MKTKLMLAAFVLLAGPICAEPDPTGIAATVNCENVMVSEIMTVLHAKEEMTNPLHHLRPATQITPQMMHDVLDQLIDRDLIRQAFYKGGGEIPRNYVDDCLKAEIAKTYRGDRAYFEGCIREMGFTDDTYRQLISDEFIEQAIRTKNVDDKIPATLIDEKARAIEVQRLYGEWRDSLHKDADIKIYLP